MNQMILTKDISVSENEIVFVCRDKRSVTIAPVADVTALRDIARLPIDLCTEFISRRTENYIATTYRVTLELREPELRHLGKVRS